MSELNLYDAFKVILKKSKVIEGRFHVLTGEGSELNTNAFDQIILDFLGQLTETKKYPCALLMPPVEVLDNSRPGWSRFKLKLFFISKKDTGTDGPNNTSGHPTIYDWKDMRQCAQDFITAFEYVLRQNKALDQIRPVDSESIFIERYTKLGNDKLNGVSMSMSVDLYMPCEKADYKDNELDAITLNLNDIHPIHKH